MATPKTITFAQHARIIRAMEAGYSRRQRRSEALSSVMALWPKRDMAEAFMAAEKLDRWLSAGKAAR